MLAISMIGASETMNLGVKYEIGLIFCKCLLESGWVLTLRCWQILLAQAPVAAGPSTPTILSLASTKVHGKVQIINLLGEGVPSSRGYEGGFGCALMKKVLA